MATELFGQVNIQFETDTDVTPDQLKAFRKELKAIIADEWEMSLYDLAEKHGMEITSIQPIFEDENNRLQVQA